MALTIQNLMYVNHTRDLKVQHSWWKVERDQRNPVNMGKRSGYMYYLGIGLELGTTGRHHKFISWFHVLVLTLVEAVGHAVLSDCKLFSVYLWHRFHVLNGFGSNTSTHWHPKTVWMPQHLSRYNSFVWKQPWHMRSERCFCTYSEHFVLLSKQQQTHPISLWELEDLLVPSLPKHEHLHYPEAARRCPRPRP